MVFISDFFTALQYSVRSSLILRNQSHRSSKQTYVAFALAGSFRGDLIRPPSPVWRHHVDISPMASAQADPRWEVIASQGCLSHSVSAVFNPLQCSALSNDCSEFCFRDEARSEERGSRVFFFSWSFLPCRNIWFQILSNSDSYCVILSLFYNSALGFTLSFRRRTMQKVQNACD